MVKRELFNKFESRCILLELSEPGMDGD